MQTQSPFFDTMAKLMNEATGVADGVCREAGSAFRGQLSRALSEMELVSRDEFEAVREMAGKIREENERLAERITLLEKRIPEKS